MTLTLRPPSAGPVQHTTRALVRHAVRLIRRSALVVALIAAGLSAVVVQQYLSLWGDSFDARSLEVLARNPAVRVMFGPPFALDDPGGFTVWRTGAVMATLLGVWAALVAIRVTRGEEEAGRWNLLLAGPFRLARLTLLHAGVVVTVALAIGLAVAGAVAAAGADGSGALLYGATLALIGAGSAAWGTLVAQLAADRRRAAVIGTAGLGAALLARMVADGVDSLDWLRWLSPFGLLTVVQPFGDNRWEPLVVLAAALIVFVAAAALAGGRRDAGSGVLPSRQRRRAHPVLLRSLARFQLRRAVGPVVGWSLGVGLYFLVVGLLSASVTEFLAANPVFARLAAQAGFGVLTTVGGYLATLFVLLAIPLGLYAAGRISDGYADEEAGRLRLVFAGPVTRRRWYVNELVAAAAGTAAIALVAGLAGWAGAVAVGADVTVGAALRGAANVLPVAWLALGAALVGLGWFPRAILPMGALPPLGGFFLDVVGETLRWPAWLMRLSPYDHITLVPYEPVNGPGALMLLTVATALAAAGYVGFRRRDLRG